VSVYLDASAIVALLMVDALTVRADAFIRANTPVLIVSDFARRLNLLPLSHAARELETSQPMRRAVVFRLRRMGCTGHSARGDNLG
jgi:hypothetical protein